MGIGSIFGDIEQPAAVGLVVCSAAWTACTRPSQHKPQHAWLQDPISMDSVYFEDGILFLNETYADSDVFASLAVLQFYLLLGNVLAKCLHL